MQQIRSDQKNVRRNFQLKTAPKPYELELSFLVLVILSGVYIAYEILAEPKGGHPLGHSLGIVGTVLMLMTEILYSVRKRTHLLNWAGPVRHWLSFHIFTGIVGPFLVLMHTGLEFRGLAGVSFFLTLVVVGSGFMGRYLYTSLPRKLSGVSATRTELLSEIEQLGEDIGRFEAQKPELEASIVSELSQRNVTRSPWLTVVGRKLFQWRYRFQVKRALRRVESLEAGQSRRLMALLVRKRELERQADMIETVRRLMGMWHILHVPIGLTLFFSVIVHVVATVYFRAGLFK